MFFEDGKDTIDDNSDMFLSDDGTISWEDVLNEETNDSIVSVKNTKASDTIPDKEYTNELEYIDDNIEQEINDEQLAEILNNNSTILENNDSLNENITQNDEYNIDQQLDENIGQGDEFDIDQQLNEALTQENNTEELPLEDNANSNSGINENPIPRKRQIKETSSSLPMLLAFLVLILVGAGIYFGIQYYNEMNEGNNVTQDVLPPPPSAQNDMNNITPEELAKRQEENIPVVNEEEAKDVKAQEEQKEEKKQIINIVPTGRSNPFVPLQKYIAVEVPDTVINYDKSGIPKPPKEYGTLDPNVEKLMNIVVSGIMYDGQKPSAIITVDNNDYFVQRADRVDDFRVVDITKNSVTIAFGKNTYRANIGQSFANSKGVINGSAQYISNNKNAGRQYYSVSSETNNADNNNIKSGRYVSESDIEVKAK